MTTQPDEQRAEVSDSAMIEPGPHELGEVQHRAEKAAPPKEREHYGRLALFNHGVRQHEAYAAAQIAELERENGRLRRCLAGMLPPGEPAPLVGAEPVQCLACYSRGQELSASRGEETGT